jgi:hypothetical protein
MICRSSRAPCSKSSFATVGIRADTGGNAKFEEGTLLALARVPPEHPAHDAKGARTGLRFIPASKRAEVRIELARVWRGLLPKPGPDFEASLPFAFVFFRSFLQPVPCCLYGVMHFANLLARRRAHLRHRLELAHDRRLGDQGATPRAHRGLGQIQSSCSAWIKLCRAGDDRHGQMSSQQLPGFAAKYAYPTEQRKS